MDIQLRGFGLGARLRVLALGALIALLSAAALSLAPAAADGHPSDIELALSLVDDSDNVVPPGGEFTVQAALRFTQPPLERRLSLAAGGNLRLYGYLDWEGSTPQRLDIPAEARIIGGGTALTAVKPDGTFPASNSEIRTKALDGRALIARAGNGEHFVYIFDAWNKRQAAVITPPAGAVAQTFGRAQDLRWSGTKSVAVWHDDSADTSWLFIGSNWDTVDGAVTVGNLYVYELDWSVEPLEPELVATLHPPQSEYSNRHSVNTAVYGGGVVISQDGSTLAVAATEVNHIGAIYVYSRPEGPGEDWGDLQYADGVKVSAVPVPSWGIASARPFDHTMLSECDAYCSRVSSLATATYRANFGYWSLDLSADGSVLVVGANEKRWPSNQLGGPNQFISGGVANNGEAYVFLAPNGDWRTTPEVTGTEIPALADARAFDPELHYSPGPLRRVTEPDAVLLGQPWDGATAAWRFGLNIEVSDDGSTVAASAHGGSRVMLFQRDSAADWADAGELLPSATLTIPAGDIDASGMSMNGDGSVVIVGQRSYPPWPSTARIGRALAYSRPADGQWTGTIAVADAQVIQAPTPRNNGDFAFPHYDLGGERLAFTEAGEHVSITGQNNSGFIWLSDSGCTQSSVDGESVWNCPITLSRAAKVVVPFGTEDGVASVTGSVTVSVDGVADSEIELSDTLEVRIGTVREVDSLVLDLATDASTGRPYPSLIERGEKTRLRLQILNENGKTAATGSVASVIVTTTVGGLTSLVKDGACSGGDGRKNCIIPVSALTSTNSGELLVELAHMGTAGAADVWATALDKQGARVVSERVAVAVAGPPATLAVAQPSSALLNYAPTDSMDARNTAALVVSATDEGGSRALVPLSTFSATLTDSDGNRVADTGARRKVSLEWPLRDSAGEPLLKDGNPQARVTVLASRDAPLAVGEYTLELETGASVGKLTAAQTINIAGGAAALALSVAPEGELEVGNPIRVTAALTDASGAPVPDGTPVSFAEGSAGTGSLVLLGSSRQLTRDGQAAVTLRAVSGGAAYVRADADGAADLRAIAIVEPASAQPQEQVTSTEAGFTTWAGGVATSAAALYARLPGVASLSTWTGSRWLSYGEMANGRPIIGSINFPIAHGDVLWLSR